MWCWCGVPTPPGGDRPAVEILDGYLIVYLNLDEVIRIVREEDKPKER